MKKITALTSALVLVAGLALLAGCGGGGSSPIVSANSNMRINIDLPRQAETGTSSMSAMIYVLSYDAQGVSTTLADTSTTLTYDETAGRYRGSFFMQQIPPGANYICKMDVSYIYTSTERKANTGTADYYIGAIVDLVQDAMTTDISITATSTVKAQAVLYYAVTNGVALSDTGTITSSAKEAISDAVDSMIAAGDINTFSYIYYYYTGGDPFDPNTWTTARRQQYDEIIQEAGYDDNAAPYSIGVYPPNGTTAYTYDSPYFKIYYSEPMDSNVDLNNSTTLSESELSFTFIDQVSGTATVTIDSSNADSYGLFTWTTTTLTNDTLVFTLYSNTTLEEDSLSTLQPAATYMLTISEPANVKDTSGNLVDTSLSQLSQSVFSTQAAPDTTKPTVSSLVPDSATGYAYSGAQFKFVFSESMDSSVDYNLSTNLADSRFSLVLQDAQTSSLISIGAADATSYGAFTWETTTSSDDTLVFTLSQELERNRQYNITSFVAPSNAIDLAGNYVDLAYPPSPTYFVTTYTNAGRLFGGVYEDAAQSVLQTTSGGYVTAGYTASGGAGGYDFWVIETDSSGTQSWAQTYGGTGNEYGYAIEEVSTGGYIVTGKTSTYGAGGDDVWAVKINNSGSQTWAQTYGGTGNSVGRAVGEAALGGYVIAGSTDSYGAGGINMWLVKLVSTGNQEWAQTYGGSGDDEAFAVEEITGGGYVLAGYTKSSGAGLEDVYVVKTDSEGTQSWEQIFGGSGTDIAYSFEETSDSGYIVAGKTNSSGAGGYDFLVMKLDDSGSQTWEETYGGSGDDVAMEVVQMSDGSYIVAGYTTSYGAGGKDVWVIKLDAYGSQVWATYAGGSGDDEATSIDETSDGGCIVAGYTTSYGSGLGDLWMIKLDSSGNIEWYE